MGIVCQKSVEKISFQQKNIVDDIMWPWNGATGRKGHPDAKLNHAKLPVIKRGHIKMTLLQLSKEQFTMYKQLQKSFSSNVKQTESHKWRTSSFVYYR